MIFLLSNNFPKFSIAGSNMLQKCAPNSRKRIRKNLQIRPIAKKGSLFIS